jgi:hypothetical protein
MGILFFFFFGGTLTGRFIVNFENDEQTGKWSLNTQVL